MRASSLPPSAFPLPEMVNPRVFFDIQIEGADVGRVIFELFADRVPKTAENFRALCTGSAGVNTAGVPLTYKGSPLHRIIAGTCTHPLSRLMRLG